MQADFQTADSETRKKLNEQITGHIAQTQAVVNAMVEAAEAAYRAAPRVRHQVDLRGHSAPGTPQTLPIRDHRRGLGGFRVIQFIPLCS